MRKSKTMIWVAIAALTLLSPVAAQQNANASETQTIKRIPLQRFDVPGTAYETIIGIAEIAADVSVGRHTHPGPESGYVIEGGLTLLIDGEAPRLLKAGESYQVPPHTAHDAQTGSEGAKVIATYVIEKGQPLASPAE